MSDVECRVECDESKFDECVLCCGICVGRRQLGKKVREVAPNTVVHLIGVDQSGENRGDSKGDDKQFHGGVSSIALSSSSKKMAH